MRILHTSDLHIGRTMDGNAYDLSTYQDQILDQILDQVRDHRPDALLLAGDILDKPNASDTDMERASSFVRRVRQLTQVVLIAGNHDGASRLGFFEGLLQPGTHLITRASQVGQAVEILGEEGLPCGLVYPIPYLYPFTDRQELSYWTDSHGQLQPDAAIASKYAATAPGEDRPYLPGKATELFAAALRRVGNDIQARGRNLPIIAMAHDNVGRLGSAHEGRRVGTLEELSPNVLSTLGGSVAAGQGLDYLALGHIHKSYPVHEANPVAWYCGAPLPYRTSDSNDTHTLLVEISPKHEVSVTPLPLDPPYRVGQYQLSLAQLRDPENHQYEDAKDVFCTVTLTDSVLDPGAIQIVRQIFPRLVQLRKQDEINTTAATAQVTTTKQTPLDIALEFLEKFSPTAAEKTVLKQLFAETQCADATNGGGE